MDIVTLGKNFERIVNLGYQSEYTEVENRPRPAPIQANELVIVPDGFGCDAGVPLRVFTVDDTKVHGNMDQWEDLIIYVAAYARTPSGWRREMVRLRVSYLLYRYPYQFTITREYAEFGAVDYGVWMRAIKPYHEAEKEGREAFKMGLENPYGNDLMKVLYDEFGKHHGWNAGFAEAEYEEDEEFDEDDGEIDEEWEDRKRIVEELSCLPEGVTGSEARDIMLDY